MNVRTTKTRDYQIEKIPKNNAPVYLGKDLKFLSYFTPIFLHKNFCANFLAPKLHFVQQCFNTVIYEFLCTNFFKQFFTTIFHTIFYNIFLQQFFTPFFYNNFLQQFLNAEIFEFFHTNFVHQFFVLTFFHFLHRKFLDFFTPNFFCFFCTNFFSPNFEFFENKKLV